MKSPWHDGTSLPCFPCLEGNAKTDVLIIGGGIAGILTAYFLHQKGVRYILAEKDKICRGTTGNTTAKITFQHSLIFDKLIKNYGVEKAKLYYEANKAALETYINLCENINCDFEIKTNYVYSRDNLAVLEKELNSAIRLGIDMDFQDSVPLPIHTVGALYTENQAQFHPLKFISNIAKNLNIYENTFIKEIRGKQAITTTGKITAEKIIVATHFPFINTHGSYFMKMYQNRSYVIALKNAENVGGMYIDEAEKGMSFRNYGDLLFVVGGSHRTGKKGGNYSELRDFAKRHYPDAKEVYNWAAQDPITLDGAPYIGHYSRRTRELYVATGFNKWGMTGAMVSAMILSNMVLGTKSGYEEAFSPHRSMIKPQLFLNGAETLVNFFTPTLRRCPHLGCALKWNGTEHSWDCPCHGSRFSEDGKILDGPANGDR